MKPLPKPGYSDYLSEAFNANLDIKGMGSIPVNKLFLFGIFILGFGNPGFWFSGVAFEMLYLYFLSTNPRFQKYVQGKQLSQIKESQSHKISQMIETLEPKFRARLQRLNGNLAEINRLMDWNSDDPEGFFNKEKQRTLNQLPTLFLKLLQTKHLIQRSLARTNADSIRAEIRKLEKQLKNNDLSPALEKSVKSNIAIQQKRLDNLSRAGENEQLVEMELQRIESQLELVREEIALDSSPEGVSSNIDLINNTLGETEAWMSTHSDFLRKLSGPDLDLEVDPEVFNPKPPPLEME